ncbi:MAG: MmcQ/YjbR family DNA-binding protein [Acidobacteria bacterium]|nr:MmcQ/YjbR family DNA-binding protein [Acidobacteriota bacterium]MBI3262807.1 MmcQ/YjbR family DNA-binding protein [Acidobacteriota bacterium]
MTFDTVREIGLALPDVEEGTAYGSPALKVRGKMFACLAVHKSAEPDSLAVRVDFDQREELLAADPKTYYLKDHYVNYAVVLVRLTRVHHDALRDLLLMGWRFVSTSGKRRARQRKRKHPAAANRS